jgi:Lipocalin-like domain
MSSDVAGSWRLTGWRRIDASGNITYPLGRDAVGLLIYGPDGSMAVQLAARNRRPIKTSDPLSGDSDELARAYSTCLAYFGTYEVEGDWIVHRITESLFPNWSNTEQRRPYNCDGKTLVLLTPPGESANGAVFNELTWER